MLIKQTTLVFFFTHLLLYSFAQQPCNDEIIINTKGAWKKTTDANMKAGNQAQVTSRIDKMQKLLQAAYPEPKGIEAKWYRTMNNNPLIANGAIPYQLNSLFLAYFCNANVNNKMEAGEETGTWFYVWANHFNWFAHRIEYFTVKQQPVYLLTHKTGEINGYPVYNGIHNENSNTGVKYSRAVIITRDNQMPYVPVTQKQYLSAFLKYNEKKLSEGVTVSDTKKRYEAEMKPVRDLLASSTEEELQQPVIIKDLDFIHFKGFSTEAKGGQQLVRLNPGYFISTLPKYVPQFLIVYWRWDKGRAEENFKNQLESNFNFHALKGMIDK